MWFITDAVVITLAYVFLSWEFWGFSGLGYKCKT